MRYRVFSELLCLTPAMSQPLLSQSQSRERAESLSSQAKQDYSKGNFESTRNHFVLSRDRAFDKRQLSVLYEIAKELYLTHGAQSENPDYSQLAGRQNITSEQRSGPGNVPLYPGTALEGFDSIKDAITALEQATEVTGNTDRRKKIVTRIKRVKWRLPLGRFQGNLSRSSDRELKRKLSSELLVEKHILQLEIDVRRLPVVADQALVDFVALPAIADAYLSQASQVEATGHAVAYLIELHEFVAPAVDVGSCASLNTADTAGLRTTIDIEFYRITFDLCCLETVYHRIHLAVHGSHFLDTMPSTERPRTTPVLPRSKRGTEVATHEDKLFTGNSYHPSPVNVHLASTLYGDHANARGGGSLTQQVNHARRNAGKMRPRSGRASEILMHETLRMQILAGALLQVTRLQTAREHAERLETSHCERTRRLQMNIPSRLDAPAVVTALQRWPRPKEAAWNRTSHVFRQMASEFRVALAVRRPGWCQNKRQATIETELGLG